MDTDGLESAFLRFMKAMGIEIDRQVQAVRHEISQPLGLFRSMSDPLDPSDDGESEVTARNHSEQHCLGFDFRFSIFDAAAIACLLVCGRRVRFLHDRHLDRGCTTTITRGTEPVHVASTDDQTTKLRPKMPSQSASGGR